MSVALALPGAATAAVFTTPALSARDMAKLLRGDARQHDDAAIALFARIGLSASQTLALLPQARALTRADALNRRALGRVNPKG